MKMESKKGQTTGMVTGLIFGIASLVIAVIIALVIVSTLANSNLIANDLTSTQTVTNESMLILGTGIYDISVKGTEPYFSSWNATTVINGTIGLTVDNVTLVEGVDYRIFSVNGSILNITDTMKDGARVTYTWVKTESYTNDAVKNLTSNLTSGINNVSSKIPTVLLIAAIVLILTIMAVLVGVWQKMRMGGGGI